MTPSHKSKDSSTQQMNMWWENTLYLPKLWSWLGFLRVQFAITIYNTVQHTQVEVEIIISIFCPSDNISGYTEL